MFGSEKSMFSSRPGGTRGNTAEEPREEWGRGKAMLGVLPEGV